MQAVPARSFTQWQLIKFKWREIWANSRHKVLLLSFLSCSPHYSLKNYVLQTNPPNREKDLSLELEIALVLSQRFWKQCNKEKARCFLKHGKTRKWTGTLLLGWKFLYSKEFVTQLRQLHCPILGSFKRTVLDHSADYTKSAHFRGSLSQVASFHWIVILRKSFCSIVLLA